MQPLHFRAAGVASAVTLLTAGLALAGCSSSSSSSQPTPSPSTSSSASSTPASGASEPASGPGAVTAITANWAKFFSAKTPIPQRIALLQNGSEFSAVIHQQANSILAKEAAAKVTHVTLTGTSKAAVVYSILVAGSANAGVPGLNGVAVYQNGVWKVGVTSFCGLLKLENNGSSKGLPAGCKG